MRPRATASAPKGKQGCLPLQRQPEGPTISWSPWITGRTLKVGPGPPYFGPRTAHEAKGHRVGSEGQAGMLAATKAAVIVAASFQLAR